LSIDVTVRADPDGSEHQRLVGKFLASSVDGVGIRDRVLVGDAQQKEPLNIRRVLVDVLLVTQADAETSGEAMPIVGRSGSRLLAPRWESLEGLLASRSSDP
jgi:hypothetical protein